MDQKDTKDQTPLFMSGPQFNQGSEKNWLSRHFVKIAIGLIIILLAIGGGYFYNGYQQRRAMLKPALENMTASNSDITTNQSPQAIKTPAEKVKEMQINLVQPETKKTEGQIIAKAAKGHGATHLARAALKEYLQNKPELSAQLKIEQKIYIEDYLQKHTPHEKILKIGNEVSFSNNLIKEATNRAQKLTDAQIKNLNKYVPLVPSLQAP